MKDILKNDLNNSISKDAAEPKLDSKEPYAVDSNDSSLKKPVMLVGAVAAGKTTLLKSLGFLEGGVNKTEAITYLASAIDTPGEMLSMPRYYNALILNSSRAGLILFLMDALKVTRLPAKIALALRAPVVGVITKVDLASKEQIDSAIEGLKLAGVSDSFLVSSKSGEGLKELKSFVIDKCK